jgi:hypothetical protein
MSHRRWRCSNDFNGHTTSNYTRYRNFIGTSKFISAFTIITKCEMQLLLKWDGEYLFKDHYSIVSRDTNSKFIPDYVMDSFRYYIISTSKG